MLYAAGEGAEFAELLNDRFNLQLAGSDFEATWNRLTALQRQLIERIVLLVKT
jgi:hypothetical protein